MKNDLLRPNLWLQPAIAIQPVNRLAIYNLPLTIPPSFKYLFISLVYSDQAYSSHDSAK